jgi:hypothetical protein
MELVLVSLAILVALLVGAAVLDLNARRSRSRINVDDRGVQNARRRNDSRGTMYDHGTGPG